MFSWSGPNTTLNYILISEYTYSGVNTGSIFLKECCASTLRSATQTYAHIRILHDKLILQQTSQTSQLAAITGKHPLTMMQFPACVLEDFSCHPTFFNHLPSWYVEWRTSATSSGCCRLPPSPPGSPLQTFDTTPAHARSAPSWPANVSPPDIHLQIWDGF